MEKSDSHEKPKSEFPTLPPPHIPLKKRKTCLLGISESEPFVGAHHRGPVMECEPAFLLHTHLRALRGCLGVRVGGVSVVSMQSRERG